MPVAIASVILSSLLLLWMVVSMRRTSRTLPSGSLVPVHGGPSGWDKWRPKETAFFVWSLGGTIVWLISVGVAIDIAITGHATKADGLDVLTAVPVVPMVILLVSQQLAFRAARRAAP